VPTTFDAVWNRVKIAWIKFGLVAQETVIVGKRTRGLQFVNKGQPFAKTFRN